MIININRQVIQGGFFISLFCDLIRQHTCCTTLRWHLIINSLKLSSWSKHPYSLPLEEKDSMGSFITCFVSVFPTLRDQERNEGWDGHFSESPHWQFATRLAFSYTNKKNNTQSDHKLLVTTFILHGWAGKLFFSFLFFFSFALSMRHECVLIQPTNILLVSNSVFDML